MQMQVLTENAGGLSIPIPRYLHDGYAGTCSPHFLFIFFLDIFFLAPDIDAMHIDIPHSHLGGACLWQLTNRNQNRKIHLLTSAPFFSFSAATHPLNPTPPPPTLYSRPAPSPTPPTGNSPPSARAAPHGPRTAARSATSSPTAATGLRLLMVPLNLRTRLARRARSRCTMCMRTGIMISVRQGIQASKRRCRGCWGVRESGPRWPKGTK